MRSLSERRIDPWTARAAEPAVHAAERALVAESAAVLADTLSIATAAESRRRLARVLALKHRAERDPSRRDAYQQAADELRNWAAGVYLAVLSGPQTTLPGRSRATMPKPLVKHRNPYTEESLSRGRSVARQPFAGQRRRRPFYAGTPATPQAHPPPAPATGARHPDLQLSVEEEVGANRPDWALFENLLREYEEERR